jgi:glycosyltransferase involved in cell wall biosynthesis
MADAFVTASVTEVHPLSVIEAMAAGLPVVGIESPGVGDIVKDGITGLLAPEEELAMFTAKMTRMVVDGDCRAMMAQQAREAVKAYSIENTTQIMLVHYQRQVEEAAQRKRGLWNRLVRRVVRRT